MNTVTKITLQVTCITKRGGHYNPHERIQAIGSGSGGWKHTEDQAIRNIESGTHAYYVSVNGCSVWVIVASHSGRKYLKTTADGYAPDNLLSLPDCA